MFNYENRQMASASDFKVFTSINHVRIAHNWVDKKKSWEQLCLWTNLQNFPIHVIIDIDVFLYPTLTIQASSRLKRSANHLWNNSDVCRKKFDEWSPLKLCRSSKNIRGRRDREKKMNIKTISCSQNTKQITKNYTTTGFDQLLSIVTVLITLGGFTI